MNILKKNIIEYRFLYYYLEKLKFGYENNKHIIEFIIIVLSIIIIIFFNIINYLYKYIYKYKNIL